MICLNVNVAMLLYISYDMILLYSHRYLFLAPVYHNTRCATVIVQVCYKGARAGGVVNIAGESLTQSLQQYSNYAR